MVNSAYAKAAIEALVNWNGKSLEEAQEIVATLPREEIEGMCWAEGSVKAGFEALIASFKSRGVEISEEQKNNLYAVILDGPENSPAMQELGSRLEGMDREGLALDALTQIHDVWVESSEKKVDRAGKEFMHTPLETIGWNTVYSDYIFLKPVMESMGIPVEDEQQLVSRYEDKQVAYFTQHGVSDRESLAEHIATLPGSYAAIEGYSDEHKAKFVDNPELVEQVYTKSGFENLRDRVVEKAPNSLSEKVAELKSLLEQKSALEEVPVPEVDKNINGQDRAN